MPPGPATPQRALSGAMDLAFTLAEVLAPDPTDTGNPAPRGRT